MTPVRKVVVLYVIAMSMVGAAVIGSWVAGLNTRTQDSRDGALDALRAEICDQSAYTATYDPPTDGELAWLAFALEDAARSIGIEIIEYGDGEEDGAYGVSRQGKIFVLKSLRPTARAQVLAHELGHHLAPPGLLGPSAHGELFADAVSYLVIRRAGRDEARRYARYLAHYKYALPALDAYRQEIKDTAALIWLLVDR